MAGLAAISAVALLPVLTLPANAGTNHEELVVGMPFAGKWAYWGSPRASCGSDDCDSYPTYHASYGADWATDLYAAKGTPVKLEVSGATGGVGLSLASVTNTSCGAGKAVRINLTVDGVAIGWVQYDHLDTTGISFATGITNGKTLGYLHNWGNLACYRVNSDAGVHTHISASNTYNYNHSCFMNYSQVGVGLGLNSPVALIGSNNVAAHQKCVAGVSVLPYNGFIVHWSGDTSTQKTAWLVKSDLKRYWIPTTTVYYCLKSKGHPGPVALPQAVLNLLPNTGSQTGC